MPNISNYIGYFLILLIITLVVIFAGLVFASGYQDIKPNYETVEFKIENNEEKITINNINKNVRGNFQVYINKTQIATFKNKSKIKIPKNQEKMKIKIIDASIDTTVKSWIYNNGRIRLKTINRVSKEQKD